MHVIFEPLDCIARLIIDSDPMTDVTALMNVVTTIKEGNVVFE
jgi:hypothetical protein